MTNVMYNLPLLSQYLPKKEGRIGGAYLRGGSAFFRFWLSGRELIQRRCLFEREHLFEDLWYFVLSHHCCF